MASGPVNPSDGRISRPAVLVLSASGGAGVMAALLQVAGPGALPLIDSVIRWGPLFFIVLVGMWIANTTINTWGKQLVTATGATAVALQSMADAMQRISQKQDTADRERELAQDHLAYTAQEILTRVNAMAVRFAGVEMEIHDIHAKGCRFAMVNGEKNGGQDNG